MQQTNSPAHYLRQRLQRRLRGLPATLRPLLLLALSLLGVGIAYAQTGGIPAFNATPGPAGSTNYTLPIQTLLTLTALTFIPAALLMMSAFTRIVIVLSMLRHALGLQTTPPNQVIIGMSLFLTFFVMGPTLEKVYDDAYLPLSENRITFQQALERAEKPVRGFMLKQTREADLALFAKIAEIDKLDSPDTVPMRILVPSFVTSELKTAFQIGFIIFIPFLIIDMVVASVLMAMGMMMMSPVMVSMPFKMMLFVLVDGWHLVIGSLVRSFTP